MALNIRQKFTTRGIDLEEERDKAAGHVHAHSRHHIEGLDGNPRNVVVVDIEWTAKEIHDEFTSYLPEIQEMMVKDFLEAVPNPGEDEEISAESDGKKRRGGVVIHVVPRNGNIRLRITH